jgi:YggT family protein
MGLIRLLLDLYVLILIADIVLSYLPQFRHHPARVFVKKASDFTCSPIRKLLPPNLPFDFSPLIVMVLLRLFEAIF